MLQSTLFIGGAERERQAGRGGRGAKNRELGAPPPPSPSGRTKGFKKKKKDIIHDSQKSRNNSDIHQLMNGYRKRCIFIQHNT